MTRQAALHALALPRLEAQPDVERPLAALLGRILGEAVQRPQPWGVLGQGTSGQWMRRPPGTVRLVDLAFAQLRPYGQSDMAVNLRLLRMANHVVRLRRRAADRERLGHHVELLAAAIVPQFAPGDCEELQRRLQQFRKAGSAAP